MSSDINGLLDMDTTRFIDEVKKYPEIWDNKAEKYTDKVRKRMAWLLVAKEICEGFGELEEEEQSEICTSLIKRWRNIKDSYIKSAKRVANKLVRQPRRQYLYAKHLTFLNPLRGTQHELRNEQPGDDDRQSESSDEPAANRDEHYFCKEKRKRGLYFNQSDEEGVAYVEATPSTNSVMVSPAATESNSDKSFFESLLPMLSDFNDSEKLEFRLETLILLKRIRTARENPRGGVSKSFGRSDSGYPDITCSENTARNPPTRPDKNQSVRQVDHPFHSPQSSAQKRKTAKVTKRPSPPIEAQCASTKMSQPDSFSCKTENDTDDD